MIVSSARSTFTAEAVRWAARTGWLLARYSSCVAERGVGRRPDVCLGDPGLQRVQRESRAWPQPRRRTRTARRCTGLSCGTGWQATAGDAPITESSRTAHDTAMTCSALGRTATA